MVRIYLEYCATRQNPRTSSNVYSKDGVDFALLLDLWAPRQRSYRKAFDEALERIEIG